MARARDALWETGHDESVEVNQRALIDKVLARYSGEFTVFRELLQNSDDAQSKAVEIHFETQEYMNRKNGTHTSVGVEENREQLPDLRTALVHSWVFKNNGILFRDQDWSRLKKIAEGNPDEEKIGAFGVGFYSLFSVTEEPFVTSGEQWMGFYWKDKKDQLFARRGTLSTAETSAPDQWTSFEMALREAAPIPSAFDFARFVASSITFMTHLSEVSIYFDDKRLTKLTKASGVPRMLDIPKGLKRSSGSNVMHTTGIKLTPLHIKAEVMRCVYTTGTQKPQKPPPANSKLSKATHGGFLSTFSSFFSTGGSTPQRVVTPLPTEPVVEIDQLKVTETRVTLSVFSAEVNVKLNTKMASELHRSTKKNPPSKLKYELIYTAKDEYDASIKADEKQPFVTGSIFQGLRADLDGAGAARVFIGHATGQTTGIGGHMATRFIPTVERESVDLVDRTVAVWNKELLYVGGLLARAAYELELANIRSLWEEAISGDSKLDPNLQSWLRDRALHALKFFTFYTSTPSPDVSSLLEAAFFSCSDAHAFSIISTAGVRNVTDVRLPDPTFSGFVKQLPVLPDELLTEAKRMVTALQTRGMIRDIRWPDVLSELRRRPLVVEEMIACLKWWIGLYRQGDTPDLSRTRTELLNAAVLVMGMPNDSGEEILPLNFVETFINTRNMGGLIPIDDGAPLPKHLLPLSVSKHFDPAVLMASFPWRELSIVDWLRHVTTTDVTNANINHDINKSPLWAERVFTVLARAWPSLSKDAQNEIALLLRAKTCIPTNQGLKLPDESYFSNANIFKDLPVVTLPSGAVIKGMLDKVLVALGVRKHVELQIVFDRMIKTGDWTVSDLIKYLVNVQATLSAAEIERLQATSAFIREGDSDGEKKTRFRAVDLYEPQDIFRQLGLPVIDWGNTRWRGTSEEAKFLYKLGLRRTVPLKNIIVLCASANATVRPVALKYFLDNYATRYSDFDPAYFSDIAFVPALDQTTPCMAMHKDVFSGPEWASLGFYIAHPSLDRDALSKLKIKDRPESALLVSLLEKTPPKDELTAQQWFGALSGHIADFSLIELKHLSQTPIVPTKHVPRIVKGAQPAQQGIRWLPPNQCYFIGDVRAQFHSKLFSFVDFGSRANAFLSACGTKHEPSVEELIHILLENPHQFYELADGRDNFLIELRNIAINFRHISPSTLDRMKKAPMLLASQRKRRQVTEKGHAQPADLDEDDWDLQYDLRRADQIVIADDTNGYQLFGDQIFTAPQEDLLESFYTELGSQRLASLIREDYKTSNEIKFSKIASDTRSLILERLPLFLHEHTHSRSRIPYSGLTDEKNFVVKAYGKLTITKSLNFGDLRLSRSLDASAAARRLGRGPIELWLAGHSQVDMYEVSTSLCRLLFEAPKINDALLFMTILSTDLRALKRRGYNVDRILRQQKVQKEAAENAVRATAENTALISRSPPNIVNASPLPTPQSNRPASPAFPIVPGSFEPANEHPPTNSQIDLVKAGPRPASTMIQNWKRKLTGIADSHRSENGDPTLPIPPGAQSGSPNNTGIPSSGLRPNSFSVTPQSSIASNIDMAIKACRQEQGHLLRNRDHMQMIKESLDEGYCDISGRAGDLDYIGEMGNVKLFVSRDVPQPKSVMTTKHDILARFIHVIKPLGEVYKLPSTSLHIFYDVGGEMIAFNRNASIFLNLRYYEAWHDVDVRNGNLSSAYISWFFTLAHEIAHNLVQPHNSEHEFYFSAICEAHIIPFGKILAP